MWKILNIFLISSFCVKCSSIESINLINPAYFEKGDNALQSTIGFPRPHEDIEVRLLCGAYVSYEGRFGKTYCRDINEENMGFVLALEKSLNEGIIQPAIRQDGKSFSVWFNFSVIFNSLGNTGSIYLFPNHGINSDRFGENYISAQRILKRTGSQPGVDVLSKRWRWNLLSTECYEGYDVWLIFHISSLGEIQKYEQGISNRSDDCSSYIVKRVMKELQYIPAHYDGKPVDSILVERFWDDSK
ncbi:MAG: hypothetical protein V4751_04580 [Pseudomonadota bacterium]